MTNLSELIFDEYTKLCLPKLVMDFTFDETLTQLKTHLFAKPQSIWIDRYECLCAFKDLSEAAQDPEDQQQFQLPEAHFGHVGSRWRL